MLTAIASLLLACPPTTATDTSKDQHYLASPYGYRIHDEIAQPAVSAPDPGSLPLWDLEAAQRQLDDAHDDDAPWIAWVLAEARGQRQTAHSRAVAALSAPTLTAARLSWWLPLANEADARDALVDAHAGAEDPHTSMLLELSLAIAYERLSCPVLLAADGACRMAGTDHLLRRDAIALELAQTWSRSALRRVKRLRLDDTDDLALQQLIGRARLAASVDDYEATLMVRAPELSETWPPIPPTPDQAAEQRRLASFARTQINCIRELFDEMDGLAHRSPELAMQVLLRRAQLMLSMVPTYEIDPRTRRDDARSLAETGERTWYCVTLDTAFSLHQQALDLAEQCLEIATTLAGPGQLGEACRELLDTHGYDQPEELTELLPEPAASTIVHSYGLVAPDQPDVRADGDDVVVRQVERPTAIVVQRRRPPAVGQQGAHRR